MEIERDVKRKDLDVYFSGRFKEQYKKTMAKIDRIPFENAGPGDLGEHEWIKIEQLEREIRTRGNFFKPDSKDENEFICTVNNLKVYLGRFDGNKAYVRTAYEYSKQSRNRIKTMDTIRFRGE
jgi:hypothetical protein